MHLKSFHACNAILSSFSEESTENNQMQHVAITDSQNRCSAIEDYSYRIRGSLHRLLAPHYIEKVWNLICRLEIQEQLGHVSRGSRISRIEGLSTDCGSYSASCTKFCKENSSGTVPNLYMIIQVDLIRQHELLGCTFRAPNSISCRNHQKSHNLDHNRTTVTRILKVLSQGQ